MHGGVAESTSCVQTKFVLGIVVVAFVALALVCSVQVLTTSVCAHAVLFALVDVDACVGGAQTSVSSRAVAHVMSDHVSASHAVFVAIVQVVRRTLVDVFAHVSVRFQLVAIGASTFKSTVSVDASESASVQSQIALALVNVEAVHVRSVVITFITCAFESSIGVFAFTGTAWISVSALVDVDTIQTTSIKFKAWWTCALEASGGVLAGSSNAWCVLALVNIQATRAETTSVRADLIKLWCSLSWTRLASTLDFPAIGQALATASTTCCL